MTQPVTAGVEAALSRLMREESGRVLALLSRRFDDLDLADESVQEALIEAARTWPEQGIPANPAGWLLTVARRKALDVLRRRTSARRRLEASATQLVEAGEVVGGVDMIDDGDVGDEHLRLVLLCCHPALDRDTQIALTLRLVGGLTTAEIAAAFLVPEATLAQRIVRAKRKIRDAGIPMTIPANLDDRVDALLGVLYLIFNEGYLSRGEGDSAMRVDLIDEAIRLTRLVRDLLPERPEVAGLFALELFACSRLATRLDPWGDLVLLGDQDRSLWDLGMINEANRVLSGAMARMQPGPFQLQATIAAYHSNARTAADTDWPMIVRLYRQLSVMTDSPVVTLNLAVAVAMADGPNAGLAVLSTTTGLDDYHLFHAARAELLLRSGRREEAAAAFGVAATLTDNAAELRHLERRLRATHG